MVDKIEIGKLFCAGEYLGEISEVESIFDQGIIMFPEGAERVHEPVLEYMTIWIVPRDGGEQDVLELLKQQVRDHLPLHYKCAVEENIYEIRGVLTSVVLNNGIIKMSLDMRKDLIDLLTARAQGTR